MSFRSLAPLILALFAGLELMAPAAEVTLNGQVFRVPDGMVIEQIEEGSAFGEVAFFDGAPRTATIRAFTPVSALVLDRGGLDRLLAREPRLALNLDR